MRDRHIGHPKHLGLLAMIMIAAISLSSCGTMQRAGSGSEAAAQATTSFLETLRQTTAPIVDSGTLPEDPSTVYVVLQSESGTNGTADGITAYQGILRRAAVARAKGLDLKAIKVTVVNAQGTPLYGAQLPVEETIDPRWYSQPGLGESDIASAVAAAFSMSGDADAARIESVRISKDFDGSQVLLVDASVVDVGTAWHGIQAVRHQVAAAVMDSMMFRMLSSPRFRLISTLQTGSRSTGRSSTWNFTASSSGLTLRYPRFRKGWTLVGLESSRDSDSCEIVRPAPRRRRRPPATGPERGPLDLSRSSVFPSGAQEDEAADGRSGSPRPARARRRAFAATSRASSWPTTRQSQVCRMARRGELLTFVAGGGYRQSDTGWSGGLRRRCAGAGKFLPGDVPRRPHTAMTSSLTK